MSGFHERYPSTACRPFPTKNHTPDLPAVASALECLLNAEPPGSPLRYPLRVALRFARMGVELAKLPGEAAVFAPLETEPPLFARVRELLGPAAAQALTEAHGGTRLYIPTAERMDAGHPLAALLGWEVAAKLATSFGGGILKVPTGYWVAMRERHTAIRQRHADGESAAKLALDYGMAEDSVYRILHREALRQPDPGRFETFDLFADSPPVGEGGRQEGCHD